MKMPRHTLSNLQINRVSSKKAPKSRSKPGAGDPKTVREMSGLKSLNFSGDLLATGGLGSDRVDSKANPAAGSKKQTDDGDTPRFKGKRNLAALEKQGTDLASSIEMPQANS